jgi:hypothetical protein
MFLCCSDDVDDQYTERGRVLIRREAEARANGVRIGDILHSDLLDVELPGLAKRRGEGWKRGVMVLNAVQTVADKSHGPETMFVCR